MGTFKNGSGLELSHGITVVVIISACAISKDSLDAIFGTVIFQV